MLFFAIWLTSSFCTTILGQDNGGGGAAEEYYYYEDDLPAGEYYYYEDEPPPAEVPRSPPRLDPGTLNKLLEAWQQFLNDKKDRTTTTPAPEYECPPREFSYRTPDPEQCDKFFECNIKGEESALLCPDGLVFAIKSETCDYPAKVDCTGRPKLQEAQVSKNCPRANGFFPWPAEESCQKFWDCREGRGYLKTCPEAVIFDPAVDTCVTPDQAKSRSECSAGKFLGFNCPQYGPEDQLRFGNHDRLPHPENCQQFFSCLKTGEPRLGACPKKTVFSHRTGHCADPATVPGCEDFWKGQEEEYDYYGY